MSTGGFGDPNIGASLQGPGALPVRGPARTIRRSIPALEAAVRPTGLTQGQTLLSAARVDTMSPIAAIQLAKVRSGIQPPTTLTCRVAIKP